MISSSSMFLMDKVPKAPKPHVLWQYTFDVMGIVWYGFKRIGCPNVDSFLLILLRYHVFQLGVDGCIDSLMPDVYL